MSIGPLHYRILQLARRHKLGHLSSALTSVGIIDEIYSTKRPEDLFILSSGHAGLALYVVLEKHEGKDAEALYLKHKTHPHRDVGDGIHASSGSLGCGITIALGMAMADRSRDVHVLVSDGESWEPDVTGVLNLKAKFRVDNLKVHLNFNGYTCIEQAGYPESIEALHEYSRPLVIHNTSHIYDIYPFLKGVEAHYHNLTDADWAWVEANR